MREHKPITIRNIILSEPHIYYVGDTKYETNQYLVHMNINGNPSQKRTKSRKVAYATMRRWAKENGITNIDIRTTSKINGQQEGIHKRWLRRMENEATN